MTKPSIEEILGKDLYEQVKAKIGDYEIAIIGPDAAMVPKRRLDEVIAERNRYKEQVAERDAQFAALKEGSGKPGTSPGRGKSSKPTPNSRKNSRPRQG